ncbi:hypothetical protein RC1_3498 [Rhodospirillum centenum SW]|uniref:Uncharacterized protein n=1 Tax=Rhodospirillum centenum (strain ATCC 51521 / SW) TaxID=414684 RepID=B6IX32_RHOCS|nr:hypothetical protein RC1_3498 [Rhodospirillum centenum SW]
MRKAGRQLYPAPPPCAPAKCRSRAGGPSGRLLAATADV